MSVIIRLQNLPWSANALDIRNFFRGLSIPEGGVHIVGGELGDAFIAFSTDEDARQAMMLNGGKVKEVQVNLLLSSRSEMHKVIETARQTVPILTLTAPAPVPTPQPTPTPTTVVPTITPFTAALGNTPLSSFGIPGIGNPHEIPQPAVIEPPAPLISPTETPLTEEDDDKPKKRRSKDRRSRSRSRSRERTKDRKRDRRDRSRSRDRRRRDRSRSRDRSDRRKRDRNNRSRSRDRSPRRSRDRRNERSPQPQTQQQDVINDTDSRITPFSNPQQIATQMQARQMPNGNASDRFNEPVMSDAFNKLEELNKKRNQNAFQGDSRENGRGGRRSRFEESRECCVAVRNAPNHTSYGDVRRFFPFMIDKHGIKMINDATGRRTGTIYVRFTDVRSRQLALQRKINELKGATVIVEPLSDDEYDAAVDSFLPFRPDNDNHPSAQAIQQPYSALKLTDLPHFVKELDIIKIFNEYSLLSIVLEDDKQTRTRIAYVQFAKPEEAALAHQRKELCVFGRRQATVEPLYEEPEPEQPAAAPPRDPRQQRRDPDPAPQAPYLPPALAAAAAAQFQFPFVTAPDAPVWGSSNNNASNKPNAANANGDDDDGGSLDCVLMKGLPRDATDRSIVTFLADTGAVPARIHLMLDGGGAPTGDCFCEFRSAGEARLAAGKHGAELAGRRVTVDLVPRDVVELALDAPAPAPAAPPAASLLGALPPAGFGDPRAMRTPAFRARPAFRGGFEQTTAFDQSRGRGGFHPPRGGFDQVRSGFEQVRGGFDQNRGGFDQTRGGFGGGRGGFDAGRGAPGGFDGRRGGFEGRGGFRGRGAWLERGLRRGRGARGGRPGAPADNEAALENFGVPGCVVSMENVPFRAAVDDILDFFQEFELSQDDIIRRYNDRGQPTGDARVAFRTPFDAQRAVNTRHMDTIFDRRVSLTLM